MDTNPDTDTPRAVALNVALGALSCLALYILLIAAWWVIEAVIA